MTKVNKTIILLIIVHCTLLIPSSRDCYSQWVIQNSGTPEHLYDVYFINTQTGWACGNNGAIVKTTNGGNNWFPQISGITFPLYSVHFVNDYIGYAVTRVDGYFQKTIDGGSNWFTVFFSPKSFESIYFIDSLTGWAAGTSGGGWLFRTTNGGLIWDSLMVGTGTGNHIYFLNAQTGWVNSGSAIYKSYDGGVSWSFQYSTIGNGVIAEFSFVNQNTGWIVTDTWKVFKTTNSGSNWQLLDTLPGFVGSHSIFFSSINTGWISGDGGYMFSTTNGGLNWEQQQTNTGNFLSSVVFLTDSIGWSVGGSGRIIFTSSSGSIVPVVNVNTNTPNEFKLFQNYPNPFNPVTNIRFDIPKDVNVKLSVYDILGKEISMLVNAFTKAGEYNILFDAVNIASGAYFYKLEAGNYTDIKKFIVIK